MPHLVNWYAGWCLALSAFVSGATVGVFFGREEFLGGYASWRRRLVRLGHIALAAMGMLNVLWGLSPVPAVAGGAAAGPGLILGGIAMPAVCFLAAWKKPLRRLFFIPVAVLIGSVVMILCAARHLP